jgi:hypothetical protein
VVSTDVCIRWLRFPFNVVLGCLGLPRPTVDNPNVAASQLEGASMTRLDSVPNAIMN